MEKQPGGREEVVCRLITDMQKYMCFTWIFEATVPTVTTKLIQNTTFSISTKTQE